MKGGINTNFQKWFNLILAPSQNQRISEQSSCHLLDVRLIYYQHSTVFFQIYGNVLLSSANHVFHLFHVQMVKTLIWYLKTIKILHYFINLFFLSDSWQKRKLNLENHLEKYTQSLTVHFTRKLVIEYPYLHYLKS